jgi:hypothetical protein
MEVKHLANQHFSAPRDHVDEVFVIETRFNCILHVEQTMFLHIEPFDNL